MGKDNISSISDTIRKLIDRDLHVFVKNETTQVVVDKNGWVPVEPVCRKGLVMMIQNLDAIQS